MCQTLLGKHLCGSSHLICTTPWEVGTFSPFHRWRNWGSCSWASCFPKPHSSEGQNWKQTMEEGREDRGGRWSAEETEGRKSNMKNKSRLLSAELLSWAAPALVSAHVPPRKAPHHAGGIWHSWDLLHTSVYHAQWNLVRKLPWPWSLSLPSWPKSLSSDTIQ